MKKIIKVKNSIAINKEKTKQRSESEKIITKPGNRKVKNVTKKVLLFRYRKKKNKTCKTA